MKHKKRYNCFIDVSIERFPLRWNVFGVPGALIRVRFRCPVVVSDGWAADTVGLSKGRRPEKGLVATQKEPKKGSEERIKRRGRESRYLRSGLGPDRGPVHFGNLFGILLPNGRVGSHDICFANRYIPEHRVFDLQHTP